MTDLSRVSPLHLASREGNVSCIEVLLNHGAHIYCLSKNAHTPLHMATWSSTSCVEFLLKHCANANVAGLNGVLPLHMASREGNVSCIEVLLNHGALVDCVSKDGSTPRSNNSPSVEILLKHGANANVADLNGETSLHIASYLWETLGTWWTC